MATAIKKKTSADKIIEEILTEPSSPGLSLICKADSAVHPTGLDHGKGKSGFHGNSKGMSLANGSEACQFVTEDSLGITGFETVVGEETCPGEQVTLDNQCELSTMGEFSYTDSRGTLIPKFVGEDATDVTLTGEVEGQVTCSGTETGGVVAMEPQSVPGSVGTLVGVTDIGGNLVTIGGQHFILFTAGNLSTQEVPTQAQVLVQPAATYTQEAVETPVTKRMRAENTLTSPLTEEGVENLVGFDAAHPNIHVEVVEEEHAEGGGDTQEEEVSMDVTQNWFTTKDDKNRLKLQQKGSTWKQGQWSKEEVEILKANITKYCQVNGIREPGDIIFDMSKDERKNFYRIVASGLNRPLFSVYRRVIRMYDQKNHLGKYTPAEVEKLRGLRERLGCDWAAIGAEMGRSASSVKDRCRLFKDQCYTGKWLPQEEKLLTDTVYELSGAMSGMDVTGGLSWAAVAEKVGSRTEKQCRTKWLNYLNWKNRGGAEWGRGDYFLLIDKVCRLNVTEEAHINWEQLAKGWSSARSPQWLRGKWWSLKRHLIPENHNMSFKAVLELLASTTKALSRSPAPRPDLPFSVKMEKSHTATHTVTTATTGHRTSTVASGNTEDSKETRPSIHHNGSSSTNQAAAQSTTQSQEVVLCSGEGEGSVQRVVVIYPDGSTHTQTGDVEQENPMMSSAVSD